MNSVTPGSITLAIKGAQSGDEDQFTKLVQLHQKQVERLARRFLGGERRSNLMLGDDVTQSVFIQLWEGLTDGRTWFGEEAITDREQLMNKLERMTWLRARKAIRHSNQLKRKSTVRDSDVSSESGEQMSAGFHDLGTTEPDLAFEITSLFEEARKRLAAAGDKLVEVFEDLLQNKSADETAERMGLSLRSIQRKRLRVKTLFKSWIDDECEDFPDVDGDAA